MAAPVALVPKATTEQQTKQSIIDILKEALVDAEAGNLRGLVMVLKEADETWHQRASLNFNIKEEIAALEIIKAQRVMQVLGANEDE
jgi:hypothetical protein